MLLLVWGVVDGPDHGWASARVLSMLAGGAVLLTAFIAWQRRNRAPMLPLSLFRSRGFSLVNVVTLAFSAGTFGAVFLLAPFFQVVQGLSPLDAGILWIALATTTEVRYGDLVLAFVLAGVGMGLTFAPISTMALASVTARERGVAPGANNTVRELGVAVDIAVLASIFSSTGDYTSRQAFVDGLVPAVVVGACIVAAGGVVALWLPRRPGAPRD
ncbi:hypothetical protein GCM10020358_33570 [Amorphoplanes nipponensis]|uniref:Major Facilitator Superfamily protein n=1 Tax=Actinoplanes nipponensis TaxID=135950 RepID=A0A919JL78_9ACTN|nr:hypothetical protein [Actinoplanes nipponensis]GIE51400.1 hypothetical protein Ani05nite_49340 [Actinoplanes nipponensis]